MHNNALKTLLPVLGLSSSLVLMGVNPSSVNAAVLIGNLPQTNDDGSVTINTIRISTYSFTTPSGSDYQLDDVILRLLNYEVGDAPLVQIRDNSAGNNPSTANVLATLDNPSPQGTGVFSYTFTPSSAFTFVQNATYWLYVTATSGNFSWRRNNPSITPTGIATFGETRVSGDSGSNFFTNIVSYSSEINTIDAPVTTPEPATVVSLIAFSVGLLATKKRKQDN